MNSLVELLRSFGCFVASVLGEPVENDGEQVGEPSQTMDAAELSRRDSAEQLRCLREVNAKLDRLIASNLIRRPVSTIAWGIVASAFIWVMLAFLLGILLAVLGVLPRLRG